MQYGFIQLNGLTLVAVNALMLYPITRNAGINILHQACMGQPLGLAMKDIMNHNQSNQYLEKPPQEYDTKEWWNRTHFAFYGDPTINVYQIEPPSNVNLTQLNGNVQLNWDSPGDTGIIGYHIYESDSALGIYHRISSSLVTENTYTLDDYQNTHWYMVKAIKVMESGCGQFLHSSIGKEVQGNLVLNAHQIDVSNHIHVYPNPTNGLVNITSDIELPSIKMLGMHAVSIVEVSENKMNLLIDLSDLPIGMYIIQCTAKNGNRYYKKIIKASGSN